MTKKLFIGRKFARPVSSHLWTKDTETSRSKLTPNGRRRWPWSCTFLTWILSQQPQRFQSPKSVETLRLKELQGINVYVQLHLVQPLKLSWCWFEINDRQLQTSSSWCRDQKTGGLKKTGVWQVGQTEGHLMVKSNIKVFRCLKYNDERWVLDSGCTQKPLYHCTKCNCPLKS